MDRITIVVEYDANAWTPTINARTAAVLMNGLEVCCNGRIVAVEFGDAFAEKKEPDHA
jgi:hypothetical protein